MQHKIIWKMSIKFPYKPEGGFTYAKTKKNIHSGNYFSFHV